MDRPPVARIGGNELSLESLYRPACPRRTLRQIEEETAALIDTQTTKYMYKTPFYELVTLFTFLFQINLYSTKSC